MNYKSLFLSTCMVASPIICGSDESGPQWKKYLTEQAVGISSGVAIGVVDAFSCTIGEELLRLFTGINSGIEYDEGEPGIKDQTYFWPISTIARHAIVHRAAQDMQEKNIPVNEGSMHISSWLSSWLCYCLIHNN